MNFRLIATLMLSSVCGGVVARADEQHYHPPGPYGDPYNLDTYNNIYGYDEGFEWPGKVRPAWLRTWLHRGNSRGYAGGSLCARRS